MQAPEKPTQPLTCAQQEYRVKWQDKSHMHCAWVSGGESCGPEMPVANSCPALAGPAHVMHVSGEFPHSWPDAFVTCNTAGEVQRAVRNDRLISAKLQTFERSQVRHCLFQMGPFFLQCLFRCLLTVH